MPKTMPQATNLKVVRELEPSPVGPGTILNHVLSISAAIKDRWETSSAVSLLHSPLTHTTLTFKITDEHFVQFIFCILPAVVNYRKNYHVHFWSLFVTMLPAHFWPIGKKKNMANFTTVLIRSNEWHSGRFFKRHRVSSITTLILWINHFLCEKRGSRLNLFDKGRSFLKEYVH